MPITFVFFKLEMKHVIRGNARSGKCSFREMSSGELSVGEMFCHGNEVSVRGTVRCGNVFEKLPFRKLFVYRQDVKCLPVYTILLLTNCLLIEKKKL